MRSSHSNEEGGGAFIFLLRNAAGNENLKKNYIKTISHNDLDNVCDHDMKRKGWSIFGWLQVVSYHVRELMLHL